MTTKQTLQVLKSSGKSISLGRLYVYLNRLNIAPAGANQRPQQYPADTAERILQHLGFSSGSPSKPSTRGADDVQRAAGIITVKQLKKHQQKRNK